MSFAAIVPVGIGISREYQSCLWAVVAGRLIVVVAAVLIRNREADTACGRPFIRLDGQLCAIGN